jgi:hypothetical protein
VALVRESVALQGVKPHDQRYSCILRLVYNKESLTFLNRAVFQDDGGLQRPLRDAWFAVGLADEAAFLQVLSNSALHLDTLRNRSREPRESPLSVYYQLRAVRSINDRRQDSGTFLSDGNIGAVTALLCHDAGRSPTLP